MILLWGLTGDGPFEAVRRALAHRAVEHVVLDQRAISSTSVEIDHRGALRVDVDGHRLALDAVRGVYWRTHDVRRVLARRDEQGTQQAADELAIAYAIEASLLTWSELTSARVINRASAMASNGSKPYQGALIRGHGFEIPRTLVTTDPERAKRFWTDHGSVIYKSLSGTRSIVSTLGRGHLERLDQIRCCPTQFQQYVPGIDHRVHVIGEEVFACAVESDADDYRYAALKGQRTVLRVAELPDAVSRRCITLTRALGLWFSGIDLRLAPDGRWFCFEVNPSPGFTYYEAHTGQPIADAVARLLEQAPSPNGRVRKNDSAL